MTDTFKLYIEVSHPCYTTDHQLADWLERIDVRSDPRYDVLRWSTPGSGVCDKPPELLISFKEGGEAKVTVKGRFTRSVSFINADNDDEKLQQLLDLLINCWAEAGIIGINVVDVYSVWQECDRAIIDQLESATDLPLYCTRWPEAVAPRFGAGKVSALQCIYREFEPSQGNFNLYGDHLDLLMDEDGIDLIGIIRAKSYADRQSAVLFFGITDR